MNEAVGFALLLSALAGLSTDELAPVSRSFGEEHLSIVGVVVGMVVMALSLWML